MMPRVLRVASWAALVGGVLAVAAAVAAAAMGIAALAGKVTYPVEVPLGPFSVSSTVTMPVELSAEVCASADVMEQDSASDCFRFFVHDSDGAWGASTVRQQDADVVPTTASLEGAVQLATTGGWSPLVAASVARTVVGLAVLSGVLLLLWRLLATAAAGEVFSRRTVRCLRGIGWLLIVAALVEPALAQLTSPDRLGYSAESFGTGPMLIPSGSAGLDLGTLGMGGLVLALAEVFRHGSVIEAERRLTV